MVSRGKFEDLPQSKIIYTLTIYVIMLHGQHIAGSFFFFYLLCPCPTFCALRKILLPLSLIRYTTAATPMQKHLFPMEKQTMDMEPMEPMTPMDHKHSASMSAVAPNSWEDWLTMHHPSSSHAPSSTRCCVLVCIPTSWTIILYLLQSVRIPGWWAGWN